MSVFSSWEALGQLESNVGLSKVLKVAFQQYGSTFGSASAMLFSDTTLGMRPEASWARMSPPRYDVGATAVAPLLYIGDSVEQPLHHHVLGSTFISQKVFIKSFCKSQFPRKYVNSFFMSVKIKNELTNLCGIDFCKTAL